jgi:hypothetical protein
MLWLSYERINDNRDNGCVFWNQGVLQDGWFLVRPKCNEDWQLYSCPQYKGTHMKFYTISKNGLLDIRFVF